jgi:hypothetical protein
MPSEVARHCRRSTRNELYGSWVKRRKSPELTWQSGSAVHPAPSGFRRRQTASGRLLDSQPVPKGRPTNQCITVWTAGGRRRSTNCGETDSGRLCGCQARCVIGGAQGRKLWTSQVVEASSIRFRVNPADVPPEKAARRLHLTVGQFSQLLPELLARGFPAPDETTKMFDLEAIDAWRRSRHRSTEALTAPALNLQPRDQPGDMAERFIVTKRRQTEIRRRSRGAA